MFVCVREFKLASSNKHKEDDVIERVDETTAPILGFQRGHRLIDRRCRISSSGKRKYTESVFVCVREFKPCVFYDVIEREACCARQITKKI